jgi:tetratricopeptide (TPR) repeat protein
MKLLFFLFLFLALSCQPSFAKISRDDYQRAVDFLSHDQFDEAIAILKTSLDADPGQAPIYNLLGMIYLKQNESITSAIGSFEEALRIDPEFADAYFNLASLYAGAANRPELAAEYFKKTLEIDPKYVKAYFGLGWFTLTSLEKPVEAAGYFEKAISYFPDFAEAYYGLGLSYIQMGKAPLALQAVSQIRALGREDLASYLESVLRGGKVSEALQGEVKNEPALDEAPPPAQEAAGASAPVLAPKAGEESLSGEPAASESSANGNSSENNNPFQLN